MLHFHRMTVVDFEGNQQQRQPIQRSRFGLLMSWLNFWEALTEGLSGGDRYPPTDLHWARSLLSARRLERLLVQQQQVPQVHQSRQPPTVSGDAGAEGLIPANVNDILLLQSAHSYLEADSVDFGLFFCFIMCARCFTSHAVCCCFERLNVYTSITIYLLPAVLVPLP